jgi:hypothetical protein
VIGVSRSADYRAAASQFRNWSTQFHDAAATLAWSFPPEALAPCPVRDTLDDALGVSVHNLATTVAAMDELAVICDRRAVICEQYAAALTAHALRRAHWNAQPPTERSGPPPTAPVPPYPWVSR